MNEEKVLQNFKDGQKIIFESEEQARFIIQNVYVKNCDKQWGDIIDVECTVREWKEKGYIRKSELAQLVDEAEEKYANIVKYHTDDNSNAWGLVNQLMNLKEALKKDHPEYKK